ncbi:Arylsulfatase [compost metagenome]
MAYLEGKDTQIHPRDEALGWEINGNASLRKGDLKLLFDTTDAAPAWRLFDLSKDPGERHDLAPQQPMQVAELLRDWKSYAQRNNIVTTAEGRPVSPALVRKP